MRNEDPNNGAPATGTTPRLPARVFYGVILAGVILGALAAGMWAVQYLEAGDREPTGRRVWGDVARGLVVPIAVMMGSTFGGLVGFFTAAAWEKRRSRTSLTSENSSAGGCAASPRR